MVVLCDEAGKCLGRHGPVKDTVGLFDETAKLQRNMVNVLAIRVQGCCLDNLAVGGVVDHGFHAKGVQGFLDQVDVPVIRIFTSHEGIGVVPRCPIVDGGRQHGDLRVQDGSAPIKKNARPDLIRIHGGFGEYDPGGYHRRHEHDHRKDGQHAEETSS